MAPRPMSAPGAQTADRHGLYRAKLSSVSPHGSSCVVCSVVVVVFLWGPGGGGGVGAGGAAVDKMGV